MTTKKAKTIRQRAQAIVDNSRRYDEDTRQAIKNALEEGNAADLKECVIRAERGDTILDLRGLPLSEFDSTAREANIARRGFPLDYDREAAQLAAYLGSDETPPKVKALIIHYLDELASSTNVSVHTPAVLKVAYPIMRFRDGASDGARVLLGMAINAITDTDERAALQQVWQTEQKRAESEATQ